MRLVTNPRVALAATMALLVASVVLVIAARQAREIHHQDPSTWPKAPDRYVRRLSFIGAQH